MIPRYKRSRVDSNVYNWRLRSSVMRLIFLLLAAAVASAKVVRYDGYHVYRVGPLLTEENFKLMNGLIDQDERLKQIILFDDSISYKLPIAVAVAPETVARFVEILNSHSIPMTLVDTNLQGSFDRTREANDRASERNANAKVGEIFPHDEYLRYPAQVQFLQDLAASSSIASTFSIGSSYEGRTITGISINDGTSLPSIYIDANTHAREWITSATLLYIADKILTDNSADAVYLRTNFRWYLLPNTNPDGFEYTWTDDRLWRKTRSDNAGSACVGTDPNRNWDSNFGGEGSSPSPCSDTYHGPRAFSEAETAAASDFLISIRASTNVMITIHSYSQFWLVPWGGYPYKPVDYDELMRVGNAAADAIQSVNGRNFVVGTPPDILYVAAGGSFDWAKESNDIKYAYAPELRPASELEGGFDIPPSHIIPSGEETFAAVVAVAREATHKL